MNLIWLTDLHLDQATITVRTQFLESLSCAQFDAAVITGDISDAAHLPSDLLALSRACGNRAVYFVLGNHDFHGGSFASVDAAVAIVCVQQTNLRHLGSQNETGIIPLGNDTALVGHRGWADARAGSGADSPLHNPDTDLIEDFLGASFKARFERMRELGEASACHFRKVLPYALASYRHVYAATHVPPFVEAAIYNGKLCGRNHRPFYTNVSAGGVIRPIGNRFPRKRLTVLCGHTHHAAHVNVSANVEVFAGRVRPGHPRPQVVFTAH